MATSHGHFASASLYVGDLHKDVSEAMLYEVFNTVGPVASIRVCRDSSRRSLGYAYVNYHSVADAERALDTLNFTHIRNMPARIMWSHRDPSLRKSGTGNIFVKNLDKSIDNKALYDTFSLFGNILSCKVSQDEFGKSRGFGFVHYETEEAAKTSIDRVNGMQIGTKTVFVGPFMKRGQRSNDAEVIFTNVYVKNIPSDWGEEKVKELFSQYGEVTSVAIQQDNMDRRFAFVNFDKAEAARDAVEHLNGFKLSIEDLSKSEDDAETVDSKPRASEDDVERDGEKGDTTPSGGDRDRLYVSRFQPKAERMAMLKNKFDQTNDQRGRRLGVNLYIKNLDDRIDDAGLRELFEPFGQITSSKVMLDEAGLSRGFGFVSYLSPDEATKAVTDMHLKLVDGKPLYVALAEKRDDRLQRLQQKMRPHVRPRMSSFVPTQVQFGAPQGHLPYSQSVSPGGYPSGVYGGGRGLSMHPGGGYHSMMNWNRGPAALNPNPRTAPQASLSGHGMGGYGQQMNAAVLGGPGVMSQMGGIQGPVHRPKGPQGRGRDVSSMDSVMPWQPLGGGGQMSNLGAMGSGMQPTPYTTLHPAAAPSGMMYHGLPEMPLSAEMVSQAPSNVQKQMLGERLFPMIAKLQPELAGKITGMMLDMDNSELFHLIESEAQLKAKVDEALRVLHQANDPVSAVGPVVNPTGSVGTAAGAAAGQSPLLA